MARREESWLKNYEDVEFDVPGLWEEQTGSGSPTQQQPMLPPKTPLKETGSGIGEVGTMGQEGQLHITGVKATGSLAVQIPPPGTTIPVAWIPRSHSAPKVFPNSPLNPSTTTSASMPFPFPFAHTRPPSRGSAYLSRIASEKAKAFGTNPAPASANHALSGTNIPTSHYSLKGLVATEDGSLPDPSSRNARISMYSTSGDSLVSLSKYLNFDSQRSSLMAYAYDPVTDELLDDDDEIDWLHDPETLIAEKLVKQCNHPPPLRPAYLKAPTESSLSWRGLLNVTVLILLISTILAIFIAYPIVTIISNEERNKMITSNKRINSTGQAVDSDADFLLGGGSTTATSSLATTAESTTSTTHILLPTTTSTSSTSTTSSRTRTSTLTMTPSTTLDPDTSTITPTDSAVLRKREEYVKKKPWPRRTSQDFGGAAAR